MFKLNAMQEKALETKARSLLILAGPGTGKTRVIVSKILKLVEEGLPPESILAVTFSRKATQEMEDRISELKPGLTDRMTVSTLHALCADLVQKHGFRLGFQKKPRIMTETEAFVFFKKVSARLPIEPLLKTSNFEPILYDLLQFFADCKDEGLWPEALVRYAEGLSEETEDEMQIKAEWRALGDIYNAYQSFCFEAGFMDFGDAILCALRILSEFAIVREEVQKSYRAILVDEFQDTNWSQAQVIRLIAAPETHVVVVGDDDQSIYRFRGASYSAFQFFTELFSETEVVELSESYRLPAAVLATASQLIAANGERRFRPNKKLVSTKREPSKVRLMKSSSYEDEARGILDEIEKCLSEGVPANQIGILVRAHSHGEAILAEAHQRGLRIETSSRKKLFEEPIVKDVLAFLKLLIEPEDSVSLLRLFDSFFLQLSAEDIFSFCRWEKNRKSAVIDRLSDLEGCPISPEARLKLAAFYADYKNAFKDSTRQSATQILLSFYQSSPLIRKLLESDPDSLRSLGRFHTQLASWEVAQGDNDLRAIFPLLESFKEYDIALDSEDAQSAAVSLLTIHASKGLEFDYVFMPSLVGRRFPSAFRKNTWLVPDPLRKEVAPNKESHLDEERRLCYVAMTRAKKHLTLSTIEKKGTKPSLFLLEDLAGLLADSKIIETIQIPPSTEASLKVLLDQKPFSRISRPKTEGAKKDKALSLSFTQLEKFETCPLSYQFKYDFQIPVAVPAHMSVGSAIHSALEDFFKDIKTEKNPSKEQLLTYFEKAFKELSETDPNLTDLHLRQGRDRLAAYYDFHDGGFPYPHAVEADFVLSLEQHKIRGKIDRIDKTNSGFRVVDYKTGRAKSNENPEDVKFAKNSLQFSIYALAAKEVLKLDVTELVFDYIYENKVLTTERSDEDLRNVKIKIQNIADNILQQKFEATPGRHCDWCEYRNICPAVK